MQGIGRGIAMALARAGADVVVTDVAASGQVNILETNDAERDAGWRGIAQVVAEIEALGRRSMSVLGDVGDEADAGRMIDEAIRHMGALDILVNNASAPHGADRALTWEVPPAAFDEVMRVNARGVFLTSAAFVRHVLGRGAAGRIVNIASSVGRRGSPGRAAYSASKFAVIGLTQSMAQELGDKAITVNAVCPGLIATARHASRLARREAEGVQFGTGSAAITVAGSPADIARAVLFLVDPDAWYITGQAINVDGGSIM
jgi:NAD(P)-dependent dehydrogenase (short-subunit alcohol dehydrogenase family)